MKTPMELALSKIELMKDIDPHSNRWENFKKNCMEQEKTHIKDAYENSINTILLLPSGIKSQKGNAEDYYNRTYKK